ncbi:MAG TPA: hypothetical protein VLC29_02755, partial [Rhizomicrobium sp.]|nr:hypothetical protein [Rhizomicrobium sp.]
ALDRLALIPNEKRRLVVLDFSPRENTHFTRCCGCVLADAFELRVIGEGVVPSVAEFRIGVFLKKDESRRGAEPQRREEDSHAEPRRR